jgi:class 3 adenylate cyclase
MTNTSHGPAWLEGASGEHFSLAGSHSIGRSSKNSIVLPGEKVSRRHVLIQAQDLDEYWLVDLGSANGTRLNDRRVIQPTRLQEGDVIEIAGNIFRFQQHKTSAPGGPNPFQTQAGTTARELRTCFSWLLLTDIKGFTQMSRTLPPDSLAQLVGGWLDACNSAIQKHKGAINKYLGDGVLAYWEEGGGIAAKVLATIYDLKELQGRREPAFRAVLHFGSITIGGASAAGEDNLFGMEMNFLFRIEKLAAALDLDCMLSDSAHQRLGAPEDFEQLPLQPVPGFEGMQQFFKL